MKIYFKIVSVVVLISYYASALYAASYGQEITITNNTATALSAFQVNLTITSTKTHFWANVTSDARDIQFKDSSLNLIPFWLESYNFAGKTASIWVNIPSIPASSTAKIYLFYGDGSLTSLSSSGNTFDLYDDFSGTLSKWTPIHYDGSGTAIITNGWARIDASGTGDYWNNSDAGSGLFAATPVSDNYIAETVTRFSAMTAWSRFFMTRTDYSAANSIFYGIKLDTTGAQIIPYWRDTTGGGAVNNATGWARGANTTIYSKLVKTGGVYNFYISANGVAWGSALPVSGTPGNYQGYIGLCSSQHLTYAEYDWVRVRKYASVDPTATYGTIITFGGKSTIYISLNNIGVDEVNVSLMNLADNSSTIITTSAFGAPPEMLLPLGQLRMTFSKTGYIFVPNRIDINALGTTLITHKISAFLAPSVGDASIVSNPFTPTSSDAKYNKVSFLISNNLGEIVSLKIYNKNGGFIREVLVSSNEISWDGKDTAGTVVSGGVYIYQLKVGSTVIKKGTVVLVK